MSKPVFVILSWASSTDDSGTERGAGTMTSHGLGRRCLDRPLGPGIWWGPLGADTNEQRFAEQIADELVAAGEDVASVLVVRAAAFGHADGAYARKLMLASKSTAPGGTG